MDQMDRVLPYLAELGALHQRHGVAKQHIDLLGLAFCAAIRGVVQGGGVKGGHLHETTKAWITLVQAVCTGMKMGYSKEEDTMDNMMEEEERWADQEEEPLKWRKSLKNNRLVDKRQAITYEKQVSGYKRINRSLRLNFIAFNRPAFWRKKCVGEKEERKLNSMIFFASIDCREIKFNPWKY